MAVATCRNTGSRSATLRHGQVGEKVGEGERRKWYPVEAESFRLSIVALAVGVVDRSWLRIVVAMQAKPHSSDRLNRHAAAFQLASQMGDMDVDEIRPWGEVVAERTLQNFLA